MGFSNSMAKCEHIPAHQSLYFIYFFMKRTITSLFLLLTASCFLLANDLSTEGRNASCILIDNGPEHITGRAECLGEDHLSGLDLGLELELASLLSELVESDNDPEVQRRVMQFMALNKKYFSSSQRSKLSQQLLMAKSPNDLSALMMCDFKNPATAWVLNFFLGGLGIDQFYIGRTGMGVLKLITGGGFGIWWLLDLFFIPSVTKGINYEEAMSVANFI